MNDTTCPWCEVPLELPVDTRDEQQCPECLTTWSYEAQADVELPLAA